MLISRDTFSQRWEIIVEAGYQIRNYILEEKIGAGGVGEVWRARHATLDRYVAIKIMFSHLSKDPDFQARFLREAVTMANLEHPNIVSVTDYFSEEDRTCLIMSYVECGSLRDWIKEKGQFSEAEALQIGTEILHALSFAHQRGVIHRDVKPSNILMDYKGQAYLSDFGIVLLTSEERLTTTGTFMGTVEYMSPEQIQTVKGVTNLSDQYSCGCVLYEMLTGHPPCGSRDGGDTEFTIMRRHTTEQPTDLRSLNPSVTAHTERGIMRALEKEPGKRFPNCEDMAKFMNLSSAAQSHAAPVAPDLTVARTVVSKSPRVVVPKAISDKIVSKQTSDIVLPKPATGTVISAQSANKPLKQPAGFTPDAPTMVVPQTSVENNKPQAGISGGPTGNNATPFVGKATGRKHKIVALVLLLLLISGAALTYIQLDENRRVRSLLTKADQAYSQGHYKTPEGSSALDYYKRVLELDIENQSAINGLSRLIKLYRELSKQAGKLKIFSEAENYANDAFNIAGIHSALDSYADQIKADQKTIQAMKNVENIKATQKKMQAIEEQKATLKRKKKALRAKHEKQTDSPKGVTPRQSRITTVSKAKHTHPKKTTIAKTDQLPSHKTKKVETKQATITTAKLEPQPKPKSKAEINKEIKILNKKGRILLRKRNITHDEIKLALKHYNDINALYKGHKYLKKGYKLIVKASYVLARKKIKLKQYDLAEQIVETGLSVNKTYRGLTKLKKILLKNKKK